MFKIFFYFHNSKVRKRRHKVIGKIEIFCRLRKKIKEQNFQFWRYSFRGKVNDPFHFEMHQIWHKSFCMTILTKNVVNIFIKVVRCDTFYKSENVIVMQSLILCYINFKNDIDIIWRQIHFNNVFPIFQPINWKYSSVNYLLLNIIYNTQYQNLCDVK